MKLHLLQKLAKRLRDVDKKQRQEVLKSSQFQSLLKGSWCTDIMQDTKKVSVLYALWEMRYRDEPLMDRLSASFHRPNAQTLTNLLYILGKFHYKPSDSTFLERSAALLKAEPAL